MYEISISNLYENNNNVSISPEFELWARVAGRIFEELVYFYFRVKGDLYRDQGSIEMKVKGGGFLLEIYRDQGKGDLYRDQGKGDLYRNQGKGDLYRDQVSIEIRVKEDLYRDQG